MARLLRFVGPVVVFVPATAFLVFAVAFEFGQANKQAQPDAQQQYDDEDRRETTYIVSSGRYVQDQRTGLCFLVSRVGAGTAYRWSVTNVPCNEAVLQQVGK